MLKTSAVCLIAKNEAPYIVEWVAHYIALGFDEILIYDNMSNDASGEILSKLNAYGAIKYLKWEGEEGESPQMSAYRHAAESTKCKYIAFFDADEFLVINKNNYVNNFLIKFNNLKNVAAIAFNWRLFGDNGKKKYEKQLLRDRFNKCDLNGNPHLKSFTKISNLVFVNNMHICDVNGIIVHPSGKEISMSQFGLSDDIELKYGQVNHYFCKSPEEYLNKRARGVADVLDGSKDKFSKYNDVVYDTHNCNEINDDSINRNRKLFDFAYFIINKLSKKYEIRLIGKLEIIFLKKWINLLSFLEFIKQSGKEK